jgi:hypothetical protein
MTRVLAIVGLVVGSLVASVASPEHTGVIFVDADGDGTQGEAEAARAGIAVTNGRDVVVTGADGRYALPEQGAGFVSITCPADARCPVWFRRASDSGRDFGIVPAPVQGDFFFVHMSDVHAYESVEDLAGLSPVSGLPWWMPRTLAGWLMLTFIERMYPDTSTEEIVDGLREVVSAYRDVSDVWNGTLMMDYVEVAGEPANRIVVPGIEIPRAFAELVSLRPAFVVSTGDMILEGNNGSPEAVERWYDYYTRVAKDSGLAIYETIGNNELAGTANDDFPPSHPLYGKVLFRRYFGPTHYSFDYGGFHFAAVDTHRPEFAPGEEEGEWSFVDMEPDVRAWLDADLSNAEGRTIAILNHEPFHEDPVWEFDDYEPAQDEGLFAKHGVAYSLAGHIHRNGFQDAPPEGGTTHITTGALSGLRWALPTSFDSRGYRLVQTHEGRLYSAWKETGKPVLGFVDPRGDAAIHPASSHAESPKALTGQVEVVAIAVDVDAPFAEVRLFLSSDRGEEELPVERWGDYFLHARLDAERISGDSSLELRATGRDGASQRTRLEVSRPGADRAP